MPAKQPVPNVVRLDWRWTYGDDSDIGTQLYWRYTGGPPSGVDCVNIAASIYGGAKLELTGACQGAVTLTGLRITDLSSPSGGDGEHTESSPGARSGASLPSSVAFVSDYQITRRYRGGKPRNYWPFGTASDLVDVDHWSGTAITDFMAAVGQVQTSADGAASGSTVLTTQCNVSYYKGFLSVQNPITLRWKNLPDPRPTPVVDDITGTSARTLLGHQRRRTQ